MATNLMDPEVGLDETSSKFRIARVLAHTLRQVIKEDDFTLVEAREIWEGCAQVTDFWDKFLPEIKA